MIDFSKLISASFWFSGRVTDLSKGFEYLFLAVLAICYAGFAAVKFFQQRQRAAKNFILVRYLERVASYTLTMAVSFTFLFFFRYERIPVLGARYWLLIWGIALVWWGIRLALYYRREIPKQMKERSDYHEFAQYLPKKK